MTVQTVRPGAAPITYDNGRRIGRLIYVLVLLGILGSCNMLDGIALVAKSSVIMGGAYYVFGDQRGWGLVALTLGALQLLTAVGVTTRKGRARWFGVAVLGLNVLAQMAFIPAYPFWSLLIVPIDAVGLWACVLTGDGRRRAAGRRSGRSGSPCR
jgi:hypothetical protein